MSKTGVIICGIVAACAMRLAYKGSQRVLLYEERSNNVEARVESYMENRPHAEFIDMKHQAYGYGNSGLYMQSKLDSLAYREIFTSSQAAANSAAVNEFNKLASSVRINRKLNYNLPLDDDLYNKLGKMVTHKQYKQIEKEANGDILTLQFKADSVAYRRFFEKYGLLNKSTLKKFTAVAKKIRP